MTCCKGSLLPFALGFDLALDDLNSKKNGKKQRQGLNFDTDDITIELLYLAMGQFSYLATRLRATLKGKALGTRLG